MVAGPRERQYLNLEQFLKLVRAHWIGVVVLTIVGGLVALGWAAIQTPIYKANAAGTVGARAEIDDPNTALLYDNLSKSEVKSYMEWAKSRSVAKRAIDDLGIDTSPEELVKRIEVENPDNTPVLRVTAQGSTPSQARDLATAWLNALASEGPAQFGGGENSVLKLRVTESAALPSSTDFPNKRLSVAVGLVAGLALGFLLAYGRGVLDKRIRSSEQVETSFETSVLGTIPVEKTVDNGQRLEGIAASQSELGGAYSFMREALSELRTNLQFVNVDNPPRTIVVTSPLPGDGKSTTTANLALSIAASGKRVVVLDGDLRRPTVASTFGLIEGVGLTDVLSGQAELTDVLQPWGAEGDLFVLGAGQIPPNPSELLGSRAMKTVLVELAKHAIVLIDAPPLIPVTDAVVLSSICDGTLVVVSAGKSTVDALDKALKNLEKAHTRTLGVVINRMPRKGPNSGYAYGYGYYSNKQSTESAGAKSDAKGRKVRLK